MAKGILIAAVDYSTVTEDEFHDWYDTEHIPQRLAVPGFINAVRWLGAGDTRFSSLLPAAVTPSGRVSLALYDLDNVAVLHSPPYRAVAGDNDTPWTKRVTGRAKMIIRLEGEQLWPGDALAPVGEAAAVLLVAMNVAPEAEAEFNEWYNSEHLPGFAAVPGVLCARRYRGAGATQRYAAIYHLADPEVHRSAAWRTAGGTPWTERMRPHFRDVLRIEARRYQRA